jgi:hypothetical protein
MGDLASPACRAIGHAEAGDATTPAAHNTVPAAIRSSSCTKTTPRARTRCNEAEIAEQRYE